MASYARYGFGLYRVSLKESQAPVGMCGLLQREMLDAPDLGYAFLPAYWRQGYAAEAAAAVLDYGRSVLGLPRLVAFTTPENYRSIKLLEKLGFRFERLMRYSGDEVVSLFAIGQ